MGRYISQTSRNQSGKKPADPFNQFALGSFAEKRVLKLVKLQVVHFVAFRFRSKISLRSSEIHRKQNFKIVFLFKSVSAVFTFSFHFFLRFSCLFFFCWAFSRLPFWFFCFGRAFRILGLGERKSWVKEQLRFSRKVSEQCFFAFFSGLLD